MKRLLIAALLLAGCGRAVPADPVVAERWGYIETEPGVYLVVTKDTGLSGTDVLDRAMKALGCGVCSIRWIGTAWQVEVHD